MSISIHAPARGATQITIHAADEWVLFQSTLPRGERRYSGLKEYADKEDFNPRSREGSDALLHLLCIVVPDFNPRSREGSDLLALLIEALTEISIHAPARGATTGT